MQRTRQERRQTWLMDLRCVRVPVRWGRGGFHMHVVTACWYKLLSRFFNQRNQGYLPPPYSVMGIFLGHQTDKPSPLPPSSCTTPHPLLTPTFPPVFVHSPLTHHASCLSIFFLLPLCALKISPSSASGPSLDAWFLKSLSRGGGPCVLLIDRFSCNFFPGSKAKGLWS